MNSAPPSRLEVSIPVLGGALDGDLVAPEPGHGLVIFAHGSGSSRHSRRNLAVAAALHDRGLGTLLIDLLSAVEGAEDVRTRKLRFDIALLASRVVAAIDWAHGASGLGGPRLGCFGASTGAAAALLAAVARPREVGAVVSRGGRPDLASDSLAAVRAPTLLIVGGYDGQVIELNREALAVLGGEKDLHVVPGATHLFEEPGALELVARLAGDWFVAHLA